jgi:D-alanyl-D-alanine carboxypeptidase-like protein
MSGRMRATPVLLAALLSGCTATAAAPEGGAQSPAAPSVFAAPSTVSAPAAMSASSNFLPRWSVDRIDHELRRRLVERNWHPGCPVPIGDLRVDTVRYLGFDDKVHAGPLVLNAGVADDVLWVFRRLFRHDFPIKNVALARKWRPIRPKDWYDTSDVTASFNCRPATGGTILSEHSYGWAVDINPLQNPYVGGDGSVLRRAVKPYVDRTQDLPGMIHPNDLVVRSFARIGWSWGGDWSSLKDYMHFSLTGR